MSTENPEISIIIPAFNSEIYLAGCLDSIIRQSFEDWELIIADDGSTDKTGEIADKYAASDKRVHVIHSENRGVSSSRNACLDIACGKYLFFVDADDYLGPDYLSAMITQAGRDDADIVQSAFCLADKDGSKITCPDGHCAVYRGQDEIMKAYFSGPVGEIRVSVWAKLFVRKKFADVRFDPKLKICEDSLYVYECCRKAEKVCSFDSPVYFYRQHDDSVMHSDLGEVYPDYFSVFDRQSVDYQEDSMLRNKIARRKTETALWLMNSVIHEPESRKLWDLRKKALSKSGYVLCSSAPFFLKLKIIGLALMPHVYFWALRKNSSKKQ